MASNKSSKFTELNLSLSNDMKVTGLQYIPNLSDNAAQYRPLVVLLHGASCTAHNFDVSPSLTASTAAEMLSIPIVSINRPGYLGSTPLSVSEGSTFFQDLGKLYHEHLFPTLWKQFGIPNGCTALVPMAHSMGSAGIIIAAALHARQEDPEFPLAGIIFSGWATLFSSLLQPRPTDPVEIMSWKQLLMCYKLEQNCVSAEAFETVPIQNHDTVPGERDEMVDGTWYKYWKNYSKDVTVPVMYGHGEYDFMFEGSLRQIKGVEEAFPKCPRFDGSLVWGAPHAIEWSHWAPGWYARCFGFAQEVSATYGVKKLAQ